MIPTIAKTRRVSLCVPIERLVEAFNPCSVVYHHFHCVLGAVLEELSPSISAFHPVHISVSLQLELQCHELNSEKQESYVENVKLKMTNDELSRTLESTSQELALAQEQLTVLQEQAARLHQEKEMWARTPTVHVSFVCV